MLKKLLTDIDEYKEKLKNLNGYEESYVLILKENSDFNFSAFEYFYNKVKNNNSEITQDMIIELNNYLNGSGKFRKCDIGENNERLSANFEDLPIFMSHYIEQIKNSMRILHPIEAIIMSYKRFIDMQPFTDKNEQTARVIMNVFLKINGYGFGAFDFVVDEKYKKFFKLAKNNCNIDAFIEYMAEEILKSEKCFYEYAKKKL